MPAEALTKAGGEDGIRTHGTVAGTRAFQARRIGHSRTSPLGPIKPRSDWFVSSSPQYLLIFLKADCSGIFSNNFQGKASYHGPSWATRNLWGNYSGHFLFVQ